MRNVFYLLLAPLVLGACSGEANTSKTEQPKITTTPQVQKQTTQENKEQDLASSNKIEQPKIVKFIPPVIPEPDPDPHPDPDPWPGPYGDPYVIDPPTCGDGKGLPPQEIIHDITEIAPEFPGGQTALLEYLKNNIRYPEQAKDLALQGKVYVGFVVRDNGKITNVEIKRGVHELLDREAMRVIKSMPDWKPGMNNGKAVNCRMILPIKFNLDH